MFITREYFIGDIHLPQAVNTYQSDSVDKAIAIYEPEILKKLLGYTLYKEMVAAYEKSLLDDEAEEYEELPERFNRLINGVEFTSSYNGHSITDKWPGFKNDEKKSLCSYYVYSCYRNITETRTTTTGEVANNKENAVSRTALTKIVYAYNRMIELYGQTPKPRDFNVVSMKGLREYFFDVSNYEHYNQEPSAYNFLLANKNDYPSWRFEPLYKINNLLI